MFEGKKILILGFARSGFEAAKILAKRGNTVFLTDFKDNHEINKINELKDLGITLILGSHPEDLLDETFDYLIKNPGVPIDHYYVLKAKELGIEVINETEMTYKLLPENITIIAITGTNGKTTTTTLAYEMLKDVKDGVYLAGNIGYPLCSLLSQLQEGDIIVMELSSQQLENIKEFRPNILVITNISPTHLDFFKTYDYYKEVKMRSFKNQTSEDIAILNMNDEQTMNITRKIKSTVKYFSSADIINGCYINDNAIYYYDEHIVELNNIKLVGQHNYENVMAAIMIAKEFDVENDIIKKVLKEFNGVEHRLEFVKKVNGRTFYNDSKATNIKSTQIALSSFKTPVILIMGGQDRGQNFMDLKDYVNNVKLIVCYGENKERIKDFGETMMIETLVFKNLEESFNIAYKLSNSGDIILLSPATGSWDQYEKFEDRGNEFKKLVGMIKEE